MVALSGCVIGRLQICFSRPFFAAHGGQIEGEQGWHRSATGQIRR